jgi:hypothetical protein
MRRRMVNRWGFLALAGAIAGGGPPASASDAPTPTSPTVASPVPSPQWRRLIDSMPAPPGESADEAEAARAAEPPEVRAIVDRRADRQRLCDHAEHPRRCRYCAQARAALELAPLTLRPTADGVGLFALGQPYQYSPPQYGWTTALPAFPPRPIPESPPVAVSPWKMPHYENSFRYLDDPNNRRVDPFDVVKRIPAPVDRIVSDFGGEFRWQGRVENSRRLLGERNDHNLFRERLYLDTWYWDRFRTFFEVVWADSTFQTVPPVFVDQNHGDFLNAFGEFRFFEEDGRTFSGRFGERQQLHFGNQRLVSPLDWVNTPRTFQNVAHGLWRSPDWNLDLFWCVGVHAPIRRLESRRSWGEVKGRAGLQDEPGSTGSSTPGRCGPADGRSLPHSASVPQTGSLARCRYRR